MKYFLMGFLISNIAIAGDCGWRKFNEEWLGKI
jgi:hypothetical protein